MDDSNYTYKCYKCQREKHGKMINRLTDKYIIMDRWTGRETEKLGHQRSNNKKSYSRINK